MSLLAPDANVVVPVTEMSKKSLMVPFAVMLKLLDVMFPELEKFPPEVTLRVPETVEVPMLIALVSTNVTSLAFEMETALLKSFPA